MLIKEGIQSQHIYFNAEIEKQRYNPYRKKNREIAENAYKNNEHLPFPLHVIVEVSSLCQLKCGFCNRQVMTRPQMNMDMEVFKKVADQCAEGGVYSLSLYALGEPLLNKNIGRMIEYAKNLGIPYCDVSTNGMEDMYQLCDVGLNEVIVSIDGNKQTHEKLRIGSNYDRIKTNVRRLTWPLNDEWGYINPPIIRLQMIDIPETHDLIPEYIKEWKDIADVICIKRLEAMSQNLGAANLSQEKIAARLKERIPCKQLWFVLTVDSNGDIEYCCHSPKGEARLGNIEGMTLKQAWDKLRVIRQEHFEGRYTDFCSRCIDFAW